MKRENLQMRSKSIKLKNGEKMQMKNGMRSGVKYLMSKKEKNGLINGQ
jgi:hypothetical protein